MQSVFFFLLRSVGRRDLSAGPEQKKKTPPRVFLFLLRPRGKAREGEAPLEAGTGPEQKKKHHPGCFLFCCGPGERQGKEKPRWKPARGQSKKKKHQPGCFFFCSGPGERQGKEKSRWAPARGQSSGPVTASNGASFPCLSPGPQQKKTPWVVFFFFALAPCRLPTGLLLPLPFAGAAAKKNTLGGVFFFAAAPRGRSLTHCGPGWRCLPLAGAVFFFLLRPRPDRGGVFFLLWPRPDAHSLTVGWGDFGKARVVFLFLLRPRRVFLDNSKKCLGYYIGSKKTRRGHSKKKNTTSNRKSVPNSKPEPQS